MILRQLWLNNFRSYQEYELELEPGVTAIVGPNGSGKTNIVEAVSFLASLKSFRGASPTDVIRRGESKSVIRAEGVRSDRNFLIELELGAGRTRVQVNRQRLRRAKDLLGALQVTVFGPDDLTLVKGGPSCRRDFVDDVLVALDVSTEHLLSEVAKILKQRSALLRSAKGSLDESASITLDVWDAKLAERGTQLTDLRTNLVEQLSPLCASVYAELAGNDRANIEVLYQRSWPHDTLSAALMAARSTDVRRAVTTVGPHRDDVGLMINGFSARSQASQGEQRTLALALRLAGHRLITERLGEPPLLLLDDVLSELDPTRCGQLLATAPPGQTLLTSASPLPVETQPDRLISLQANAT